MPFSWHSFSSLMASFLEDGGVPTNFEPIGPYTGEVSDGEFVKGHLSLVTHPLFEKPVFMKTGSTLELVGRIETESKAYQLIQGKGIGPEFLGHVKASGRVIGFLTEWVEGARPMDPDNAEACFQLMTELHGLGITHGDAHHRNFLYKDGKALMIDFEMAVFESTKEDFDIDIGVFNRSLRRVLLERVSR